MPRAWRTWATTPVGLAWGRNAASHHLAGRVECLAWLVKLAVWPCIKGVRSSH